ncbi:alpha-amylase family glycosyl hydrolase [Vibrio sp. CAU 1672]|uniref:alpha-amylase family glycosyl hydrolase n=1 Tax=Vibrio sp. CAU 1672 TaxID=3032594 RepID=UPI0023DB0A82|nr:alpha-amylase family glycosyl hydrolase [Vibrio sp. CAU 1672]MDF2152865.1 alpha-amylase family glycosyl hydrolase [Vibrio sp. CAU 1672]
MKNTALSDFIHPDWTKSANIYEVNLRQFTDEGTIAAFRTHLPRLKDMGVDILWFMPVHPIGKKNRKGSLGSGYSVQDYYQINPELGTFQEFQQLIKEIHELGMYAIIDWVANHTAWDHDWVTQHPDWYKKNESGDIHAYIYDNGEELEYWDDVVGLDYNHPQLWDAMTDALSFWVRETDIDGFRCDVAGLVPTPFWEEARRKLNEQKPVFMLAEWSTPELHEKAFDMTYDWGLYQLMKDILSGEKTALDIQPHIESTAKTYPYHAYRMAFTTNHDKNSWDECDKVLYGDAFHAFAVLTTTLLGMPLVYSGQESGLDKKLDFFEKDPINWKTYENADLFKYLLNLKKDNPALWNGQYGGKTNIISSTTESVICFYRKKGNNMVTVIINLSNQPQHLEKGYYHDAISLDAFEYKITASNDE